MSAGRVGLMVLCAIVALLITPEHAWAWTPGTHVFIGRAVLDSAALLPAGVADLLARHPLSFLYGSIAPDTSFAKDYAPVHRHSHHWHVGQEVHDQAVEGALQAFGLGYLSHLAADVVAHNFFVPRQLAATAGLKGLGHAYWEARFESHLGERWAREARELLAHDHAGADEHLDRIISPTLFSIPTNRRLFRGMVHLADRPGYRRAFQFARERSRWDIHDDDVERHMAVSHEMVMRLLAGRDEGPRTYDPTGAEALKLAKGMRRRALQEGGRTIPKLLWESAEAHFGVPRLDTAFWNSAAPGRAWVEVDPTHTEAARLLDDADDRLAG